MKETNDRNFVLFAVLGAIGSLLGGIIVFSSWSRDRQERKQAGQMFELQRTNLEEVNKITAAIAKGAEQNVESLNTMLSTFQEIMKFKVAEAKDLQEIMKRTRSQLDELEEAQGQQVEELLRGSIDLRRPRFQYTNPEPDLQQRKAEFRRQMDPMQRVILDRYTGAKSPQAENRRYGEIYLRRGVIAYYDNDMVKSRQMLRIAEQFFPPSPQEIVNMSHDQRISTAFTQFYLALIEKNYGDMAAAQNHIEKSYEVYGQDKDNELLTPTTRAEILSYIESPNNARIAIQTVLDRAKKLQKLNSLQSHDVTSVFRAYLLLGNTYYIEGMWDQALEQYQEALKVDVNRDDSYYVYNSIAQVYHKKGDEDEAKRYRNEAYQKLLKTGHLRTKVALDTRILLNALAYFCTREDRPAEAREYADTIRELWLRIHEVSGLQLRLFSLEQKRLVDKHEFWTEIFKG